MSLAQDLGRGRQGNSGGEIALEVAASHPTWLAGEEVGQVPFRVDGTAARLIFMPLLFRLVAHHLLTVDTPIGRRMRPKLLAHGQPLVRVKRSDLAVAGVQGVPRVMGARDGLPVLDDGHSLEAANVIWCTGYRPGFSWIDLPIFGEDHGGYHREPAHHRGIVASVPRSLLRRPVLLVRDVVRVPARSRARCRVRRGGHRVAEQTAGTDAEHLTDP